MSDIIDYGHGISAIDSGYQRPRLDAIHLIVEGGRAAIVDTGVNSSVPRVLEALRAKGIAPAQVDYVVLTHIHLDHAGAAGTLLRRLPDARLFVHSFGAKHMIDPTKLLASATRIYGDRMDRLWGAFDACPPDRVACFSMSFMPRDSS